MIWLLAASSALACCAFQADLPRDVVLLSRIRRNVQEALAHLPNYTCLESIERSTRSSASHRFKHVDSVEIEVAHVGNREMFARPGAHAFDAAHPSEVVGSGLTTSGEYATQLRSIFESPATTFTWEGEENLNGRRGLRYGFLLPVSASEWQIRRGQESAMVSTRGSFWADAASLEVFRIDVQAGDIPSGFPARDVANRIEYANMRIGDSETLLPQTAEFVATEPDGRQHRNITQFSHCRQYLGESVISFGAPTVSYGTAKSVEILIPAGLGLRVRLENEIDLAKASVGDLVRARVVLPAVKGGAVVPKGAVLKGRLRRLERSSHIVVGLEFTELEFENKRAQFFGRLESIEASPGVRRAPGRSPEPPGVATLVVSEGSKLPRGLTTLWQTQNPPR